MNWLKRMLCRIGLHSTYIKTHQIEGKVGGALDIVVLRYAVCKRCKAGDPYVTGEW